MNYFGDTGLPLAISHARTHKKDFHSFRVHGMPCNKGANYGLTHSADTWRNWSFHNYFCITMWEIMDMQQLSGMVSSLWWRHLPFLPVPICFFSYQEIVSNSCHGPLNLNFSLMTFLTNRKQGIWLCRLVLERWYSHLSLALGEITLWNLITS